MVKRIVKGVLVRTRCLRLACTDSGPSAVILRYHSIQDRPELYETRIGPTIIHPTNVFERQMEMLIRYYNWVTIEDVALFLKGKKEIAKRSVAVTFDDGFADNFNIVFPILERLGVKGSFFIIVNSIGSVKPPWFCRLQFAFRHTRKEIWPDSVDRCARQISNPRDWKSAFLLGSRRCASLSGQDQERAISAIESDLGVDPPVTGENLMMTWDQVRELNRAGHVIGAHSLSHPNLAYIGEEELHREVIDARHRIEEELRGAVVHFSYPSPILQPHYNAETLKVTAKAGYQTALTCAVGRVVAGDNSLALKRIPAYPDIVEFSWSIENTFLGRVQ